MTSDDGGYEPGSVTGVTPPPTETDRMVASLHDWWMELAAQEVEAVAPKAVEYGPNSMIEVGRMVGRMSGHDLTDEEAIELACLVYIGGKIGRWVDAVAMGKRVSDDSLHDIGVYVRMAQRTRAVGSWPNAVHKEN